MNSAHTVELSMARTSKRCAGGLALVGAQQSRLASWRRRENSELAVRDLDTLPGVAVADGIFLRLGEGCGEGHYRPLYCFLLTRVGVGGDPPASEAHFDLSG